MAFEPIKLVETSKYPKEADTIGIRDRIKAQLAIRMADALINSGLLEYKFIPGSTEVDVSLTLDLEKYVKNAIKQIIDDADLSPVSVVIPITKNRNDSFNANTSSSFFASYPTGSFNPVAGRPKSYIHDGF